MDQQVQCKNASPARGIQRLRRIRGNLEINEANYFFPRFFYGTVAAMYSKNEVSWSHCTLTTLAMNRSRDPSFCGKKVITRVLMHITPRLIWLYSRRRRDGQD